MQEGGCHPVDGCLDGDDFAGANFEYLAANVFIHKDHGNEHTLFPPYGSRSAVQAQMALKLLSLA